MFRNYIITAFRNLIRNKGISAINVLGLVLGISCFLIIFLWVKYQYSFDRYIEHKDEIYRVIYKQNYDNQFIESAVSPSPLGPALKNEFPEVVDFTRYSVFFGEVMLSYHENRFYEGNGAYADPGFLDMFSIEIIEGNKKNPLFDPYSIILTESLAKKYFGDIDPINKILYLEGFAQLKVTAIIKDVPNNSHLKFDFLVPYILFEKWGTNLNDWNNWGHQYTYVLLEKGVSKNLFENQIVHYLDKHEPVIAGEIYLQELLNIHFNTEINYDNYSDLQNLIIVRIFIAIGIIILLIACLNYINLTTAQYLNRRKEIGVRKILGARKSKITFQFLIESFIITFFSIHISLILIELIRTKITILNKYNLTIDLSDSLTIILLFSILIIGGIFLGIYPSLFMSRQDPLKILKNGFSKFKGFYSIRKLIVITQFILASCLIIISFYSYKQINYLKNKDLGYNPDGVIAVQLRGKMTGKYNSFKNSLQSQSYISYVSYGSSLNTINASTSDVLIWKGKNENNTFEVFSSSIDFDYMEMLNIKIMLGRGFSEKYSSDLNNAFIINEAAMREMELENPIGKNIEFMGKKGQIIGIAKDYHYSTFFDKIDPLIISIRQEWRNYLFFKTDKENYEIAIKFVENEWNKINPEFPFNYTFLSDELNKSYLQFYSTVKLITYFTIIAILIALIGLNALTSYITKSRTKEIGVRKVLGASGKSIVYLLNWGFLKIVLFSYVLSVFISISLIKNWMQMFAYKDKIDFKLFFFSCIAIVSLTIITISIQVFNAARKNPVDSLRYE